MLRIPAILSSYQSLKDKTLKIVFESQEPSPDQIIQVAKNVQGFGYLAFKKDDFKQAEIDALEGLKADYEDKGKSKSQRLKAVLYRVWEQKPQGYDVFDDFYNARMEKLINHFKNGLD